MKNAKRAGVGADPLLNGSAERPSDSKLQSPQQDVADLAIETLLTEYFGTGSKKGRGKAQRSLDLIEAMHAAAEAAQPITGRGIGYKLFTAGLIPSMARAEMQRVYRLLKEAREQEIIP